MAAGQEVVAGPVGAAMADGRGWYARRGIVVAENLDQLQGPLAGTAPLPLAIEASHRTGYDFGDAHQRAEAYRVVLMEAVTQEEFGTWLDRDELVRGLARVAPAPGDPRRLAESAPSPGGPPRAAAVAAVPLDPS